MPESSTPASSAAGIAPSEKSSMATNVRRAPGRRHHAVSGAADGRGSALGITECVPDMRIISFATRESEWKSPRLGIILHTSGVDSGERLDCEKLFAPAERPSNPLAWFDMDGRWLRTAREAAARLESDPGAFAEARRSGWLVPSRDAYWFAP